MTDDLRTLRDETYDRMPELSRGAITALVGAMLVAAALRLWNIGEWSMWVDEAHSFRDATVPFDGDGGFRGSERSRYPVSFLLLRWYLDFVGNSSEGWLRLPFVFVGTITVPLLAIVGRPLIGTRPALFAAFLLAVNPWHIFWSQNVRAYALVLFFGLAAMGLVWQALVMGGLGRWLGAVALIALAGFSHTTAFGLFGVVLVLVLVERMEQQTLRSKKLWLWVVGIALLALVGLQLAHYSPAFQAFAKAKPDASLLHLLTTSVFYFRVPLIVTAAVGMWFLFLDEERGPVMFLAAWVGVPAVLLAVFGSVYVKATARYAFYVLPAVLMLASLAVARVSAMVYAGFSEHRRLVRWLPAGMLPLLLLIDSLASDVLYHSVQRGDRPGWREATRWVKNDTGVGNALVFSTNEPSMRYYFDPEYWRLRSEELEEHRTQWTIHGLEHWRYRTLGGPEAFIRDLIATETRDGSYRGPGIYAIVTRPELDEMDPEGTIERFLRENFQQSASFPAWVGPKDHTVYVFAYRGLLD